eukprot:TRINITY_DN2240_c0_g2_i1.p1 TRINITY_DN2240_c0_g2~~TRINITY_DN2240_c0_g2_i1.p1  ORF type:complete len:254 (+),score=66.47 TRINITY_DN2240_c0_g2_i1:161-922(+)
MAWREYKYLACAVVAVMLVQQFAMLLLLYHRPSQQLPPTAKCPACGTASGERKQSVGGQRMSMCVLTTPYKLGEESVGNYLDMLNGMANTTTWTEHALFNYTVYASVQENDELTPLVLPRVEELLRRLEYPFVVVRTPWRSFVGNLNTLAKTGYDAGCDYFFIALDDTMMVTAAWTSAATHVLHTNGDIGLVGIRRVQVNHSPLQWEHTGSVGILSRKHIDIFGQLLPSAFTYVSNIVLASWISFSPHMLRIG